MRRTSCSSSGKLPEWAAGADGKIRAGPGTTSKITAHHAIIPTTVLSRRKLTAVQRIYYLIAQACWPNSIPSTNTTRRGSPSTVPTRTFVAHGKAVTVPG